MKTNSPLMKMVQSRKVLERSWRVIQENASTSSSAEIKQEVQEFAANATSNIIGLSNQLAARKFAFDKARGITIPKQNPDGSKSRTKFRPIVLAPLRSRIVQRAILEALGNVPDLKSYAENPYSFGGIRKQADNLAAVPAAVQAVIRAIENGATHVAFADIRAFFTKIPKPDVVAIIRSATGDNEFTDLVEKAIRVELENMAELKEKAQDFPIEAIGVAQGNSLSPLLGNILLHEFDRQMNKGDCVCIRYIDDFIILAPSEAAARSRMRLATRMLKRFKMELSAEKSSKDPLPVTQTFDWLGIEFSYGTVRPARKAVTKLEENVRKRFDQSCKGMRSTPRGDTIPKKHSLLVTLNRIDSIIRGWGKHYRFCSDESIFEEVDQQMQDLIRRFIGEYSRIRICRDPKDGPSLLGMDEVARQKRVPFVWKIADQEK